MEVFKKCCSSGRPDLEAPSISQPTLEEIDRLFEVLENSIQEIKQKGRHSTKVYMSQEMQNNAALLERWMMKHFNEVTTGVQISRDVLNAIGKTHWICAGLTIVAMGLDIILTIHDNKEQSSHIISELLDMWKEVMKPMLVQNEGKASKYMEESISLLIEGYMWCKKIVNSSKFHRCILVKSHKEDLAKWKEKLTSFKVNTILKINVDMRAKMIAPYPTSATTSETITVGLEERIKEIKALLDLDNKEESKVVVVHGMGGIGKSTLADIVYKEIPLPQGRCRSRIEIGEDPSRDHITKMQKQMVVDFTGDNQISDIALLKDRLRRILLGLDITAPLFIYIDNVLDRQHLENFLSLDSERIVLPKGSRWLVTTRDASVCTDVFGRIPGLKVEKYRMMLMNDSDAEKLFYLHAFGQEEPPLDTTLAEYNDAQGLVQKMVSFCGHLPIALRVLGRSLFHKDVSFWRKMHDDISNHGNLLIEKRVYEVLKLSYNTLSDNIDTQTAFLLVCVFFVTENYVTANNVVESILPRASMSRLFELGLLEIQYDYGDETFLVKMHDLVKNLGQSMAAERNYAPTKMPTCVEDFEELDESWSTIKWLRIPRLEDNIDAKVLGKCRELEVLVLRTCAKGKIEDPPPQLKALLARNCPFELHQLNKLAYLNIYEERLEEFPVATSRSLRIFRNYTGKLIPDDAIEMHKKSLCKLHCVGLMEISPKFCEQMSKLQSLALEDFCGGSLPQEMGSLTSLEFLQIISNTIQELPHSLNNLTRLQFLDIGLQSMKEIPDNVLGTMSQLQFLRVHLGGTISLQQISQLSSLEMLSLQISSLETSNQEGPLTLNNLKFLDLTANEMLSLEGIQFRCPSLQYATLRMQNLQVLPSDFLIDYAKLQLNLFWCDALEELPSQMHLHGLWVRSCESLKALPEDLIESLQCLVLESCPKLVNIPHNLDKQKIQSMKLFWCNMQESLLLPPHISLLPNVVISDSGPAQKHPYVAELLTVPSFLIRISVEERYCKSRILLSALVL